VSGRPRWCGVCGVRVPSSSPTLEDLIAYCPTHAELVKAAEKLPRDPAEELPTMAAELRRLPKAGG